TNEPISAAVSDSAVSAKILVSALPNMDSLSNAGIYSFFASKSNSSQLDNDNLKQIDADDLKEMDLKWKMAMLTVRARRFLQRIGRNLRANRPTSMGFDMSKVECYNCHRKGHFVRNYRSPKDTRKNGTFMPPKPDLVFHNNDETDHTAFNVELSPTKPENDLSHTHRPSAPIIEDWVSDSEDESATKISQNVPSFVQPTEQVKSPRNSVQHVETSILAANPKTASLKPKSTGSSRNRKACFVCKSLTHLIKDLLTQSKFVPITAVRLVTTVVPKPTVTRPRQAKTIVPKLNSPPRRHINRTPSPKASNFPPKDTAVKAPMVNVVQDVRGKWEWKPKCPILDHDNPQHALKNQGVIDSGCSRHMTGNMSYLSDFEELNGGYVSFCRNPKGGKISGKGKIRTGKLDFDDVYFVNELKFNLFSISQMCDKKNGVLFTDTKCLFLSPDFKLPDENQVLLRVPRENNMYNVDLKNIVPYGDLTCLFAKATLDESNLWNKRLGHINFKTMNKLVKGNLVRGLPSKVFKNDHTCVACKKGKQHRASCKTKPVISVNQPLQRLYMDLFRPTFVKTINKKSYCLVVTDDYSRFTWVFFLATKDETSPIITGLENQLSLKIKIIRSDNGTELKNNDLNQFCGMKGIKKEFIVPRTPQQNGIAERKTRPSLRLLELCWQIHFYPFHFKLRQLILLNTDGDAAFDEKEPEFERRKPESEVNVSPSNKFEDFSDNSINEDNVAGTLVPAVGQISINSTITFSVTGPSNAAVISPIPIIRVHKDHLVTQIIGDLSSATQTRSMTRVAKDQGGLSQINNDDFRTCMFACFLSQEEPKRVHQALKDPRHTQEEGIDYEEVFAPVARIEAIWLFLAYASFMGFMVYQMDVKSAFLYGTIKEEVYVCQPPGFEDPNYPDKNIVPYGDLTCLFAKATLDESNLWHKRLGHINFKTMNKLVKGNLVRGLPSKVFENDHTCVACKKGKQHKASCKTKPVSSVNQPLQRLYMDLFRPTFVKTMNKKSYCLVVTDDYSRFTWVFFLATKDETSPIITGLENKLSLKIKIIRSDNGTEFKNNDLNQFCRMKGIKREFSNTDGDAAFDEKEPEFKRRKPESEVNVSPSSKFEDFSNNSINEDNVAGTLVPAVGQISINSTITFSVAGPSNAAVSPTQVKSSYMNSSQLPDDLNMPELEDITYFDDEDDVGVEVDFTNLETSIAEELLQFKMQKVWVLVDLPHGHTQEEGIDYEEVFALVARIEAIRLFLAYASFIGFMVYQMDVKSAFLYGTIKEEVYVCQPSGFEDPNYPDKVYKVFKALYGLHQAPRAWYETLANYLLENSFSRGMRDQTLFIKRPKDGKSASTPIDTEKPLLKDPDGEDVDVHTYRSMIGSLMYLTSSRPDIMFAVVLSGMESLKRMLHVINILIAGSLTTPQMVLNSPCLTYIKNWLVQIKRSLVKVDAKFRIDWESLEIKNQEIIFSLGLKEGSKRLPVYESNKNWVDTEPIAIHDLSNIDYISRKVISSLSDKVLHLENERLNEKLEKRNKEIAKLKSQIEVQTGVTNQTLVEKKTDMKTKTDEEKPPLNVTAVSSSFCYLTSVTVKKVNDVTRLQALVDKKRVIIMEAIISDSLRLDDAEGINCLPNEEIFTELARMGYEKPSIKLTFYKAFFSCQWKFLTHTILQCMSDKRTSWNKFSSSMASAVICRSTGDDVVHVDDVPAVGVTAEGAASVTDDEVPTVVDEPSVPSPPPPTPPPPPSQDIPSTLQTQSTPPPSPIAQPQSPQQQSQPS
nr:putative ribonuclease H-like domain-containing protein [Tanacetum cinerariifolium]